MFLFFRASEKNCGQLYVYKFIALLLQCINIFNEGRYFLETDEGQMTSHL